MPLRLTGSASLAGFGTCAPTGSTISGDVPQLTCGWIVVASISTVLSKLAPGSDFSVCQYATAAPQCSGFGANGRPFTRSEEHTSELQSLMRISYAVFCLTQKKNTDRSSPKH